MSLLEVDGKFRARALKAELGRAGTGTPQIGVCFAVVEGEYTGAEITAYLYLSDAALKYTVKSLRATGWQGDDLDDLSTVGSIDCELVVQWDEYQGKDRLKVQFINALGGGGVAMSDVMTPDERKKFAASMRGKVIAASKDAPAPKSETKKPAPARTALPAPRGQEPPPPTDDDIPF